MRNAYDYIIKQLCQFHKELNKTISRHDCCTMNFDYNYCLNELNSLGSMPKVYSRRNSPAGQLPDTPSNTTCKLSNGKRKKLYGLLKEWISIAEKYKIIWWITFGTLLGSIRNNDIIPYDHDVDVAVLDTYEPIIRKLADESKQSPSGNFRIVTRPGNYCVYDRGSRTSCYGYPVPIGIDECSFCLPVARIVLSKSTFLDLFSARVELRLNTHGELIDFGIFDEGYNSETNGIKYYPLIIYSLCRNVYLWIYMFHVLDNLIHFYLYSMGIII
uniref:LicD/FKTN/FKRP nucleotidyltransferase domain-containing protein n=1 Tax=Trichobilharzia regenti TaxID=157069 RepID=A0AA85K8G6_TRIRE|nr:unnamed protein product [Trichobilharzia regenti]